MQNTSERNRLRYVGRVPQETLDYLSAKKREDLRKRRILEIPLLVIAAAFVACDVAMLVQNKSPLMSRHTLDLITPGFIMAIFLLRGIRQLFA